MEIVEKIKSHIAEIKAKKEELVNELKKEFAPMLKPLFDKSNGKITSIGWTQYTPYFNDGDTCRFSTLQSSDSLYINGESADDIETLSKTKYDTITVENLQAHIDFNSTEDGYSWYKDKKVGENGIFPNPDYDKELDELVDEFSRVLSSIDDEFYKDLFGDHVKVTVHADGRVETEEYEHD